MSTASAETRKLQAERELGTTDVRPPVAAALVAIFLATVVCVPVLEEWLRRREPLAERQPPALAELPAAAAGALRRIPSEGWIAADLGLLETIHRAEDRLEERSFLRELLLPRAQAFLLAATGLGNEEVYPGRDGWLFYRADVDHLTGPGFLDPEVLRQRRRGGEAWQPSPQPDPMVAISALARALDARGIALVLMPTPLKPSVRPELFARRPGIPSGSVRNRSTEELERRVRTAGAGVFDPLPILGWQHQGEEPRYLRADTHWTPAAMEWVAEALAAELEAFDLGPPSAVFHEREIAVEGGGDLTAMLRLPDGQTLVPPERVTVRLVTDATGSTWRPTRGAPVLLLGDSFTNVFSEPRLGWGAGAGLAERLSFHLQRPVDRIAQNAGGAHASREALARDPGRLVGTRVVVYQFAERELSFGDWRLVELE